ncbi:MAG TPA: hypothetical protein VFY71_10155 [Planctomycetota bacterium]|nr:hypothetical protein [Planctomycetota bacterium]
MLARILATCVVLGACLAPLAAQAEPARGQAAAPAVTPEQAAAAAKALEKGLAAAENGARIAALREAAAVDHDEVAKVAAKALIEKDEGVRIAAAETLGGMSCKESLTALHRGVEKKQNIEDSKVAAALFKAIGRHADVSSVPVLGADPFKNLDADVVRARIYSLGNIRSRKAVDELMKLMLLGNPTPGQDSPYMPVVRVALVRLTGTDQTTNKDLWQAWWRENKDKFEVAAEPAAMPVDLQTQWDEFWGVRTAQPAGPADRPRAGG